MCNQVKHVSEQMFGLRAKVEYRGRRLITTIEIKFIDALCLVLYMELKLFLFYKKPVYKKLTRLLRI